MAKSDFLGKEDVNRGKKDTANNKDSGGEKKSGHPSEETSPKTYVKNASASGLGSLERSDEDQIHPKEEEEVK